MSFSKKFISSFVSDVINNYNGSNIVRLFAPLQEVKVVEPNIETYTVVRINAYTMEEELILYPAVVVHQFPNYPSVVIDIE